MCPLKPLKKPAHSTNNAYFAAQNTNTIFTTPSIQNNASMVILAGRDSRHGEEV